MTAAPKDSATFKIDDNGSLRVPRKVLAAAGLDAKMRVRLRVEGKHIVIEKAAGGANPLDGELSRNLDRDLFGKIQQQQQQERKRAHDAFEKGLRDAPSDPEPPDNPFRYE